MGFDHQFAFALGDRKGRGYGNLMTYSTNDHAAFALGDRKGRGYDNLMAGISNVLLLTSPLPAG